jgi:hypothetical protein
VVRHLVSERDVVHEIVAAYEMVAGERVRVGYDLVLSATHRHHEPGERVSLAGVMPGCARCADVWRDIEEIARAITPEGATESSYRIRTFDGGWHFDSASVAHGAPRIELTIEVRNLAGGLAAEIDCERRCVDLMSARLTAVGARLRRG